jgi:hypothetical protein
VDAPQQARSIDKAAHSDESAIFSTNRHFSNFGQPQNRSARPVDAGRALDGKRGEGFSASATSTAAAQQGEQA